MLDLFKNLPLVDDDYDEHDAFYSFLKATLKGEPSAGKVLQRNMYREPYEEMTYETVIFEYQDKFFEFSYNVNSWEEYHGLGEMDFESELREVFPKQVTVTIYE